MKGVDCTRSIGVCHQLADVTSPGLLSIIAHCRLEGSEDGREEGQRRGRRATLLQLVVLLLSKPDQTYSEILCLSDLCVPSAV